MEIIKLTIRTYKVPIKIENNKVIETTIDMTPEMLHEKTELEIEGLNPMKLQEEAQKVAQYNKRQLLFAKTSDKDYILKKFITKN